MLDPVQPLEYETGRFPHLHWLLTTQIEISLAGKVSLSQSKIRRDGKFPGNNKGTQFPNQKFTTAREQLEAISFFFFFLLFESIQPTKLKR